MGIAIRVLLYQGSDEWIEKTLNNSLPQGVSEIAPGKTITETTRIFIEGVEVKEEDGV